MRKSGITILILGIAFIGASSYVKNSISKGKLRISSAQSNIDRENSFFSLSPATEDIGKELSKPFQKKINKGETDIQKYEILTLWLKVIGAIFFILGLSILFIQKKK